MSESKLFEIFVSTLDFNVADYLVDDLTDFQKKVIDDATFIIKDNIVGDLKVFGGSVKKNEEKFNILLKNGEKELEKEKYKDIKKILKEYLKKLSELIIKTSGAIIPVKELPWIDVIFRTIPILDYDGKINFSEDKIAYYGEVKCFTGRTIIYGTIKGEAPLFAPLTGNLDLQGLKPEDNKDELKSHNFSYVNTIIKSLNSPLTRNQLAKYHESFQRHGDPICDFLNKDADLLNSMKSLTTISKEDLVVNGIMLPIPAEKKSLVLIINESNEANRYEKCFEALLKLSAASCNVPSLPMEGSAPLSQVNSQESSAIRTPGGQELKVWTSEELSEQAQQRLSSQPNLPSWTEEDLVKLSQERGTGIPEGMEVWTEEQLQELAEKRRGGGLNIPEWKPDESLIECSNCGYSLRPGWSKCPICDTPVGDKFSEEQPKVKETDIDSPQNEDSDQEEENKNENKS